MSGDFIEGLGEYIKDELTPNNKMKVIDKENFRENLLLLKERIVNLHGTLSGIALAERKLMAGAIFKASSNKNNVVCNMYVTVARRIGKSDLSIAFDSAIFIANSYITLLGLIDKSIATTFEYKAITIYNTKLSHLAIFGLVKEIELFADYTAYLCDGVVNDLCQHNGVRELPPAKQYRQLKLSKNVDDYVNNCRARLSGTTNSLLAEVDKLKKNMDVNLVAEDNTINSGFIQVDKISPLLRAAFSSAKKLFIFRWLGEQWELLKYAKYQKAKKEKEWLEAHVALLQLDLQGADPNGEEYRKLVKIIEAYNEMITDLDQKIDSYMNE